MKVSIIIPAYNEEKRIGSTLPSLSVYLEDLRKKEKIDYKILVVINATTDKTEEVVKKNQKKNKRIQFLNLKRGGKGFAVKEGFKSALSANSDLIGFIDADLATPPEALSPLLHNIGRYDGIIANRYDKKSKIIPRFTFRRIIVAKVFNLLVRSLFFIPYKDTQCGAKFFKREAADYIVNNVKMSQWAFDVELLYALRKKGFKVKEEATIWRDVGGSKINLKKSTVQMFLAVLQLRIVNSPLKRILRPFKFVIGLLWRMIR